jgi:hypothetical protein
MQLMPTQYCHAPGRRSRRMSSASISGVAPRGPETEQCKRRRAFGGRAGARRVAFQDADAQNAMTDSRDVGTAVGTPRSERSTRGSQPLVWAVARGGFNTTSDRGGDSVHVRRTHVRGMA